MSDCRSADKISPLHSDQEDVSVDYLSWLYRDQIIMLHGVLSEIISDRDLKFSFVYQPQTNGQLEWTV